MHNTEISLFQFYRGCGEVVNLLWFVTGAGIKFGKKTKYKISRIYGPRNMNNFTKIVVLKKLSLFLFSVAKATLQSQMSVR